MNGNRETFRIAFDAGPWERPPHSMRRVLTLLLEAATDAGWPCELWTRGDLQPEFAEYASLVRQGPGAWQASTADVLWCPGLADKQTRLPVISTIHDVNPLLPDGRPRITRFLRRLKFRSTVRASVRRSFQLVTDTGFAKSSIEDAFPQLRDRLAVVPLYADREISRVTGPALDATLSTLGLKPGYILFVGSLRKHKNWDGLLRAYAALPPSLRQSHPLVLAGPAHRSGEEARSLSRSLGVDPQVTIPGTFPDSAISALYSGAALFVFPSFLEGFGLPPLEAMACGVPVVATRRTSVPEVLGDAALYVDPASDVSITTAMRNVLEDPALAAALVAKGASTAASYSPARTAAAMLPLLRAALVEKTLRMVH